MKEYKKKNTVKESVRNALRHARRRLRGACALLLAAVVITGNTLPARATAEQLANEAEERKSIPVESSSWKNWAQGPVNGADGAVLMDAYSGALLYSKNPEKKEYPASITKLMTALLACENCAMDEQVSFSHYAVYSIERGSSNVGIDEGQSMSVEECLYCLLLASANEVANALAEHVSGSVEEFAQLMNARAKQLGCVNTHFVNPNGLHDPEHYTCAYDMALIARAFFANETLLQMSGTVVYDIHATANQPDEFTLRNHHRSLPGCQYGTRYQYDYAIGGKNGFTVDARETLVTCAEKDEMRLIAIIMREEPHNQFTDTTELFEYGFSEFKNIAIQDELTDSLRGTLRLAADDTVGEGVVTVPNKLAFSELSLSVEQAADHVERLSVDPYGQSRAVRYLFASYDGRVVGTAPVYGEADYAGADSVRTGGTDSGAAIGELPSGIENADAAYETAADESASDKGGGSADDTDKTGGKKSGSGIAGKLFIFAGAVIVLLAAGFLVFSRRMRNERRARRRRREIMERVRRRREYGDGE